MMNGIPPPPLRGASLFLYAEQTLPALERNINLRITRIRSICESLFERYDTSCTQKQDAEILKGGIEAIGSLEKLLAQFRS